MEIEAKYALPDEAAGLAVQNEPQVRPHASGEHRVIRMESEYD